MSKISKSQQFLEAMTNYHQHCQRLKDCKVLAQNGDSEAFMELLKHQDILDKNNLDLDMILGKYGKTSD
jgi:hypothetical protein